MIIKSKYFSRRDMLKFGITVVGIVAMPKGTISGTGITRKKAADRIAKEHQRISLIAKKYGGEFGGIEPEAGRN